MRVLAGLRGKLRALAYSPDGSVLAAAGESGVTKLWNPVSGAEIGTILQPEGKVQVDHVAFSPDGVLLATATTHLRLWDTKTSAMVAELPGMGTGNYGLKRSMVFTPDGSPLILNSRGDWRAGIPNASLPAWDWKTQTVDTPFSEDYGAVAMSVCARTGVLAVASIGLDREVYLLDLATKKMLVKLDQGRDCMNTLAMFQGVCFSPSGQTLVVAAGANPLMWEWRNRHLRGRLVGHDKQVTGVAYSPDGKRIATSSHDGTVRFWNHETLREERAFDWKIRVVRAVAFSPDGLTVAAVGESGKVIVWDVE